MKVILVVEQHHKLIVADNEVEALNKAAEGVDVYYNKIARVTVVDDGVEFGDNDIRDLEAVHNRLMKAGNIK